MRLVQSATKSNTSSAIWPIYGSLSGGLTTHSAIMKRLPMWTVACPAIGGLFAFVRVGHDDLALSRQPRSVNYVLRQT